MCNLKIRGITIDQMYQLVEMTEFFYQDENTAVYCDPDCIDNIVITAERGDNYNSINWFQMCYDLILPKIVEKEKYKLSTGLVDRNDMIRSFIEETIIENHHPIDLLYPVFLAIKSEKDGINSDRENTIIKSTPSKA